MNRRPIRVFMSGLAVLVFPFSSPAPLVFRPGAGWIYDNPSSPFKFFFGSGPAAPGFTQVTPQMTYSSEVGFGFEPGADLKSVAGSGNPSSHAITTLTPAQTAALWTGRSAAPSASPPARSFDPGLNDSATPTPPVRQQ